MSYCGLARESPENVAISFNSFDADPSDRCLFDSYAIRRGGLRGREREGEEGLLS